MKKLILISALLFSVNGWAEDNQNKTKGFKPTSDDCLHYTEKHWQTHHDFTSKEYSITTPPAIKGAITAIKNEVDLQASRKIYNSTTVLDHNLNYLGWKFGNVIDHETILNICKDMHSNLPEPYISQIVPSYDANSIATLFNETLIVLKQIKKGVGVKTNPIEFYHNSNSLNTTLNGIKTEVHFRKYTPKKTATSPRNNSQRQNTTKTNTSSEAVFSECIKGSCINGLGAYLYESGSKYEGLFKNGKRHGRGTYTHHNGNKYVGGFKDDNIHGQGTYTWATGEQYTGGWKDDKRHGQGTLTHIDGRIETGNWENNKFIGSRKPSAQSSSQRSSQSSSQRNSQRSSSTRSQAQTDAINALMRGLIGGGGFALIAFLIVLVVRKLYTSSKKIATKAKPKIESTAYSAGTRTRKIFNKLTKSEMEQLLEIDDKYFQIATDEIESNTQQQGLWIKVGTLAEGNIEKQKALYVKQRAKQLSEKKAK